MKVLDKNILVVSRAFRAGDAITTLNLFSKWPKANLYCASLIDSEYISGFRDFYLLGNKETRYRFPFNYISSPAESKHGFTYIERHSRESGKSFLLRKAYEKFARPLFQWLDIYETRLSIGISEEFDRWVRHINPEIIYTSIGDIAMAEFLIRLHDRYPDIKFVIHGFDDWMSPTYKIWSDRFHRRKAEKLFRRILSFSSARFTSSEIMAKEYSDKYGYDFICFPNPVKITRLNKKHQDKTHVKNIVFTGKVGWHNNHAIKDMIAAVEDIVRSGTEIVFDIYTDTSSAQLESFIGKIPSSTIIHKPVPNSMIPEVLAAASILYLPINIDNQTAKFTKYSMSTKMGEYLSSGVPVIYYGPEGIAMTEFLKESDCSLIVTTRETDRLVSALNNALFHDNEEMLQKAKTIADRYFNKDIVSGNFKDKITEMCLYEYSDNIKRLANQG